VLYTDIVEQVQTGTWKFEEIWVGVKDGVVDIAPLNESIPQNLQAKSMAAREPFGKGRCYSE
ncbi:MAG: BMP family ABC transporter substrate-binding protein, partial [Candidatus Pelethousia sp.]|nr:BMP family ABC transporter substrate-binding protein [Candidatus Pelethousia sp.]